MAGKLTNPRHFILTGVPGVGKTTLVKAIQQELNRKGIECCGFVTEEVRSGSRRVGFDVITTSGQRGQLARVSEDQASSFPAGSKRDYRVGQYSVNLLSFEQTALPTLLHVPNASDKESANKVFVIDEIGKMEMFSKSFIQAVERLLSHPSHIILATIPVPKGKPIPLVEKVRNGHLSKVYEVTKQNRDSLLKEIVPELYSRIASQSDR